MNVIQEMIMKSILNEDKAYVIADSTSTITVGIDSTSPSYLAIETKKAKGLEMTETDGRIKNISGRTLEALTGCLTIQPSKIGDGYTSLNIWVERSIGGLAWESVEGSLTSVEIPSQGETSKSIPIVVTDLVSNEYIRVRAYTTDSTVMNLVPPSVIANGETLTGYSAMLKLKEN